MYICFWWNLGHKSLHKSLHKNVDTKIMLLKRTACYFRGLLLFIVNMPRFKSTQLEYLGNEFSNLNTMAYNSFVI